MRLGSDGHAACRDNPHANTGRVRTSAGTAVYPEISDGDGDHCFARTLAGWTAYADISGTTARSG